MSGGAIGVRVSLGSGRHGCWVSRPLLIRCEFSHLHLVNKGKDVDINKETLERVAAIGEHVLKLREELDAMRTVFIGTLESLAEDTQNQETLVKAIAVSVANSAQGMQEEAILQRMRMVLGITPPSLHAPLQQALLDQR